MGNPIGVRLAVKIRDAYTGGAYSVHDNAIPPGSLGPRPRLHRDHDETLYVLDGKLTVRVGPRRIVAPAGSFVVVPRGLVHQPSNPGTRPVRVLLLFSPGGMSDLFEKAADECVPLQEVPEDRATRERVAAFTARYAHEFADLPPES